MSRTKLKLTDLQTGQEYLLVVTKMNLRGLLVETTHTLRPGTSVRMSLHLDDGRGPLTLDGEVHKIAERNDGGKGMILRFVDPSASALDRIGKHAGRAFAAEEKESGRAPYSSRERTQLADLNTLSKLTLSSGEDEAVIPSTMDEEAVHAANPGLAGATRISIPGQFEKPTSRPRRAGGRWFSVVVGFGALAIVATAAIWGIQILRKPPRISPELETPTPFPTTEHPEPGTPSPFPAATATSVFTPAPPTPTQTPEFLPGTISTISVEDGGTFLKLVIRGTGDLGSVDVSRATNPRRFVLDFPSVTSFTVDESIAVSKNPLLRIKARKKEKSVQLILDLYPVEFPRTEVKRGDGMIEFYLHR